MPDTPVVNISTVWTAADALAGGIPMPTSKEVEMTPNAIPSAPSISWAAKPAAMNGTTVRRMEMSSMMSPCRASGYSRVAGSTIYP